MGQEYKLNRSELSRLKRQEKLYLQYLPVLKLKQEQLYLEKNRIKKSITLVMQKKQEGLDRLKPYIPCFSDKHSISIIDLMNVDTIETTTKNIAGISIKVLNVITFKRKNLPYFQTAPWVLRVQTPLEELLTSFVELIFLEEEQRLIGIALRKATQKVNLFDKVLIPKTKDAIKRIKIALGDEQVASISRGKIAKAKISSLLTQHLPAY